MQTQVVDKSSGVLSSFDSTTVVLDSPGFVKLAMAQEDILSFSRSGDDLIVQLASGEVITIENFYLADASSTQSDLFIEDPESGEVLLAQQGVDGSIFSMAQVSSGADVAGVIPPTGEVVCPWVWAGLAALGIGAIAASYDNDDNRSTFEAYNPPPPPPPPPSPPPPPPPPPAEPPP
ncbi:BapA/Bap/LapF family prefix-like domain-containing protein, partial [Microbulbifer mangrovi]|uniref:BapA/Bap/LapF family prefix-like domain-containing protein n=1 Tax=Microbulbifer mangrovi TaxID=927787 RepID=UPI00117C8504